jgi:rhamnogalacturonyl hydrolase YesR
MKQLLALLILLPLSIAAQKLPKPADVLRTMHLTNDYFTRRHPDPAAPTFVKKERPSNLWTRGVYFEGLMALQHIDPQQRNADYITRWAQAHRYTPRNGITTRDADDYCCAQTYLELYLDSLDTATPPLFNLHMLRPTLQCMDNLLKVRSIGDWTWIDAIQMGLPVLTHLSLVKQLNGEEDAARYSEHGFRMYTWTRDTLAGGLLNKADGLWWRDKDFVPPYREPGGGYCYWSRGNGWVYAALVRAMDDALRSPAVTHFDDYKADFLLMTDALLKCQRKDGFWNVSLHDDTHFGGPELTGTALFIYGMAWGVRQGVLPRDPYLKIIAKTWKAMVKKCVDKDGRLGYVQGTGKEPKDSQPVTFKSEPDFDDFGLGCFLLAASEVYLLTK